MRKKLAVTIILSFVIVFSFIAPVNAVGVLNGFNEDSGSIVLSADDIIERLYELNELHNSPAVEFVILDMGNAMSRNDSGYELPRFDTVEEFFEFAVANIHVMNNDEDLVFYVEAPQNVMPRSSITGSVSTSGPVSMTSLSIQYRYSVFRPPLFPSPPPQPAHVSSFSVDTSWVTGLTVGARWDHKYGNYSHTLGSYLNGFRNSFDMSVTGTYSQGAEIGGSFVGFISEHTRSATVYITV